MQDVLLVRYGEVFLKGANRPHFLKVLVDNIKRAVKMVAFIQSAPDFYSQAQVANGGSQLLLDVIDAPAPARSAIGMAALPLNVPVEIEVVFEVE